MTLVLLLLCLLSIHSETEANSTQSPRLIFTDKETRVKRLPLPGHDALVQILPNGQPDSVIAATPKHLNLHDFHKTPVGTKVLWDCPYGSSVKFCSYNLTVVLKMEEANHMFMCGVKDEGTTTCCEADISARSHSCVGGHKMDGINERISSFHIKAGESAALDETGKSANLYITISQMYGIYKFGKKTITPSYHGREQHYVGLILSRRRDNSPQNRVYAFYKEKNQDSSVFSGMWLPYVTQVCMSDLGGSKSNLQNSWTSQRNAKLFCGDVKTKQHFSDLVDVSIIHADEWQKTRVYGLFRNEWGMSALCVFTIQDIDHVFKTSPFKGSGMVPLIPRECVADSTKLPPTVLGLIKENSQMDQSVQPEHKSGPLFLNHHNYTHISADSNGHHTVIFLSLNNGRIHKVIETEGQTSLVTEYRPFNRHVHIHSIVFKPSSRKLYVYVESELVQLDVGNCAAYGDSCEQCVLARDPYCHWDGAHCSSTTTTDKLQDLTAGVYSICSAKSNSDAVISDTARITLPYRSRYFLQCPVLSNHARYSWHHHGDSTPCLSNNQDCVLLIDKMSREKEGVYKCVSEELDYVHVQAQYHLQLENRAAGPSLSPLLWVCLLTSLITRLSSWF